VSTSIFTFYGFFKLRPAQRAELEKTMVGQMQNVGDTPLQQVGNGETKDEQAVPQERMMNDPYYYTERRGPLRRLSDRLTR
jgi:hypothetical protein